MWDASMEVIAALRTTVCCFQWLVWSKQIE